MTDVNSHDPVAAYESKDNISVPPESIYPQLVSEDQPVAPFVDVTPDGPVARVEVPEPEPEPEPEPVLGTGTPDEPEPPELSEDPEHEPEPEDPVPADPVRPPRIEE